MPYQAFTVNARVHTARGSLEKLDAEAFFELSERFRYGGLGNIEACRNFANVAKVVERYQQLLRRVALLAPGTVVRLGLSRGGQALEVHVTLTTRPAQDALRAMAAGGRIDALGLLVRELEPQAARQLGADRAVRIEAVLPGGPAELAGLARGDLLLELNRLPVGSLKELDAALAESEPNEALLLKVRRGDAARYVALKPR